MSDLISREDAIEAIEEITWYHQNRNREMVSGANSTEDQAWYKSQDIYAALEALPSAEARPTGEWIPEKDTGETMLKCSECECRVIEKWYRMAVGTNADKCPYCGAYMITRWREADGKKKNTV